MSSFQKQKVVIPEKRIGLEDMFYVDQYGHKRNGKTGEIEVANYELPKNMFDVDEASNDVKVGTSNDEVPNDIENMLNNLVFNNQKIDAVLDKNNEIWFKGKDVAFILDYKDTDQVIRKNIEEDDKKSLEEMGPVLGTGLSHNDKNTIYINELGLYDLILSSKKEEAKKFRKWITHEILPSIRKHGEYKLRKEFEEKLSLKDKEYNDLINKNSLVTDMMIKRGNIHFNQIFYIATTKKYTRENIFKIGGVEHTGLLKSRFQTYNTERPKLDSFYCVAVFRCHDYKLVEHFISSFLFNFRLPNKKELFRFNLYDLINFVTDLLNYLEDQVSDFNCSQEEYLLNIINTKQHPENMNIRNFESDVWMDTRNLRKNV